MFGFSPLLDGDGVASPMHGRYLCRRCLRFSPLLDGDGVASPLVLLAVVATVPRFSPLLDGDGVASPGRRPRPAGESFCFSPLLDGDGVASRGDVPACAGHVTRFQSPSRWGRCCIEGRNLPGNVSGCAFQSPSRWGRCCIVRGFRDRGRFQYVSVPFSMGTVLHPPVSCPPHIGVGVSVPFSMGTVLHRYRQRSPSPRSSSFSPLLDGDGVASRPSLPPRAVSSRFQSPSRWGRCCITCVASAAAWPALGFSPLLDGDGVASLQQVG